MFYDIWIKDILLDVTNPEPLPNDHPLWSNPRCIITPYASGTIFKNLDATDELL